MVSAPWKSGKIIYPGRYGKRKITLDLKDDLGVIGKRGRTKRSPYMRRENCDPINI